MQGQFCFLVTFGIPSGIGICSQQWPSSCWTLSSTLTKMHTSTLLIPSRETLEQSLQWLRRYFHMFVKTHSLYAILKVSLVFFGPHPLDSSRSQYEFSNMTFQYFFYVFIISNQMLNKNKYFVAPYERVFKSFGKT